MRATIRPALPVEGYIEVHRPVPKKIVQYDLDLSWIGEEVTVLYQDNNLRGDVLELDSNDTIYGVTKTGDTAVYNITKADLQDANAGKIKFGGVNYSAANEIRSCMKTINSATKLRARYTGLQGG